MNKWIIIILIIFISCTRVEKKINPFFDENLKELIFEDTNEEFSVFPKFPNPIFIQGQNNKIIKVNTQELKKIYEDDYSHMNYKKFLSKALNQQITFNDEGKWYTLELDKKIKENYESHDFISFLKIYTDSVGPEKHILKIDAVKNMDEENSIFYYAFINNYLTAFDDYIGYDYIYSISSYFRE